MQWPATHPGQRNTWNTNALWMACVRLLILFAGCALGAQLCAAQAPGFTEHLARNLMAHSVDTDSAGLVAKAMDAAWYNSADGVDFEYLRQTVDAYLQRSGGTSGNDALAAVEVLRLYRVTLDAGYFKAASRMRDSFMTACAENATKATDGGKAASCADAAPFLAEYASVFHDPASLAPISATLLRHAQAAGDARTVMALVDVLASSGAGDSGRGQLTDTFVRMAGREVREASAKPGTEESSAFLVYAVLKGVRLCLLPRSDAAPALRIWSGVQRATPNDASRETQAALLLASTEVDLEPGVLPARGKTILMDGWFNSQTRKNAAGQTVLFHYKWDDYSDSGFSLLGHLFRSVGMRTDTLADAPTQVNLRGAQYYMIVSPDIPVKNPHPNYMTEQDADEVAAWVRDGGVLILMENDPPNADIAHLNLLADKFGIHFDDVLHHHVLGESVENGRIPVAADGTLFREPHTFYMKDTCAISLHGTAKALLRDRGDVVMAEARFGRGLVFAVVDPWLYNEYTDGRKNPAQIYAQFDNFAGGRELVRWLAQRSRDAGASAGTRNKEQ